MLEDLLMDDALKDTYALAQKGQERGKPLLFLGESGTGKSVMARKLHEEGPRQNGPFIEFNCASLTEQLADSELFGNLPGAFTGARLKPGFFEAAHQGTLFMDEVAELPLSVQAKLLLTLRNGQVRPVGSTRTQAVDVYIMAATNKKLHQEIAAGRFRKDLFFRLADLPLKLPALRDRPPEGIKEFIRLFYSGPISPAAMDCLLREPWEGNIPQLRQFLTTCELFTDGNQQLTLEIFNKAKSCAAIHIGDSSDEWKDVIKQFGDAIIASSDAPPGTHCSLADLERDVCEYVIKHSSSMRQAARSLGLAVTTLSARIKRWQDA